MHCQERCHKDRSKQLEEQIYQRRSICIDDAQPMRRSVGLTCFLEVLIDRIACFSVHCQERCHKDRAEQLEEQIYQRRLIGIDDAQPMRSSVGLT